MYTIFSEQHETTRNEPGRRRLSVQSRTRPRRTPLYRRFISPKNDQFKSKSQLASITSGRQRVQLSAPTGMGRCYWHRKSHRQAAHSSRSATRRKHFRANWFNWRTFKARSTKHFLPGREKVGQGMDRIPIPRTEPSVPRRSAKRCASASLIPRQEHHTELVGALKPSTL